MSFFGVQDCLRFCLRGVFGLRVWACLGFRVADTLGCALGCRVKSSWLSCGVQVWGSFGFGALCSAGFENVYGLVLGILWEDYTVWVVGSLRFGFSCSFWFNFLSGSGLGFYPRAAFKGKGFIRACGALGFRPGRCGGQILGFFWA